ncbi:MFS transporter [Dysgonomonas termitidis]|uniref:MFS transporter n=1 Tax=Dysgonomonas termitidis TaxID=1516126 RepID=A0ABV9KU40_9BACT
MDTNKSLFKIIPVMFAFFVMGFVDLVGIATNHVKLDFRLSDTVSSFLPSMVFLWFFIFSIPTGLLMNKIGRRKTVLLSLIVTFLAMIVPLISYSLPIMLVSFALLGIGNTLMQVSLNPLITNIVSGHQLASTLTLGQFFKAIASFIAPIIASWAALEYGNWRLLYPVFAGISIIAIIYLFLTPIKEDMAEGKTSSFIKCLSLLANKVVVLLFIGILVHVGIDVGVNLTAPKILMERLNMNIEDAGYAISLYFVFRTIGCFSGAFILSYLSAKRFFILSVVIMLLGVLVLFFAENQIVIYVCIALLGIGNSNIFPMIFSQAMHMVPDKNNEVSGLMIMGIAGGAIFPVFMGVASDTVGSQAGAIAVITLCILYLVFLTTQIKGKDMN